MDKNKDNSEIAGHSRLYHKNWAKLEIFAGALTTMFGLARTVDYVVRRVSVNESIYAPQLALELFIGATGIYFTLAAHRSMLYRSQNQQTKYLEGIVKEILPKEKK